MDWLASPLWSLFYLSLTLVMMGFAYYSRSEVVQRVALFVFATHLISHGVFDNPMLRTPVYVTMDIVGMLYCLRVAWQTQQNAGNVVAVIFASMLFAHIWHESGLVYVIAGNLLYVAQLAVLSTYGWIHGRQARCIPATKDRHPPFHKATGIH